MVPDPLCSSSNLRVFALALSIRSHTMSLSSSPPELDGEREQLDIVPLHSLGSSLEQPGGAAILQLSKGQHGAGRNKPDRQSNLTLL